jgi:hypothetical protein
MHSFKRSIRQVYKIILFFLPIFLILVFVEWKLFQIPNSYSYKRSLLENSLSGVQVLVMGSSHAYYDIRPDSWSVKGINMANTSQSLYYDNKILMKYIKRMPALQVVLIPVSYFSLEYDFSLNEEEYWRQFYYFHFLGIPEDNLSVFDIRNYSLIQLYSPKITRQYMLHGVREDFIKNIDKYGWYRITAVNSSAWESSSVQKDMIRIHSMMKKEMIEKNKKILVEMIRAIQHENKQVVLLTTPVSEEYIRFTEKDRYNRMQKTIQELVQFYHVPYYNYFSNSGLKREDYADAGHLNAQGAEKFSKIIQSEILSSHMKEKSF